MQKNNPLPSLTKVIFFSRWLQAPLYVGLIIVLAVYVYVFGLGLIKLIGNVHSFHETEIMLQALDLIDVVMIANLLIMVIVGGFEVFVSRLHLKAHPDHPEWLDEVDASSMKVKLALALITISAIHLLRTFIDPSQSSNYTIMWQVIIHAVLMLSAVAIALIGRIQGNHNNQI